MAACIRARGPSQGPVVNSDGSMTVRTDARYVVEGTGTEISQICAALPGFSEQMAETIALLRFDNVIGTFHIPSLGTIQVISEKLDAQSIEGMLYDISQTAADLPFHATEEASRFQFHRTGADPQILYHLFVVIQHLIPPDEGKPSAFLGALQAVLANPHRLLRQTIRRTATPLSKRPHVAHLVQDVASSVEWAQVAGTRWIPSVISEEVVRDVVDTPENRFVKHVLATISWIIEEIMRLLQVQPHQDAFAQSVLDNAYRMLERLKPMLQQPLWDQVSAFTFMPTTSTVLHRRYGYQQIYHMYLDLYGQAV